MDCTKGFCSNYMLLNHDKIGILDLARLLFSSDIEHRKFIDSKDTKEESFKRRWIIFLSIVVQKILQLVSKPLYFLGWCIEMWLSLLTNNDGLLGLVVNLLTWKVVKPDISSATFISFAGNFDYRTNLDRNIKREDPRYSPALAMMAAKASYENQAYLENIVTKKWEMEFLGFFNFWNAYQNRATTQAFMMRDRTTTPDNDNKAETIVVAFRGTEPFDADAWCTDVDISWYELQGMGKVHAGFMKALGLQKCTGWPKRPCGENEDDPVSDDADRPLYAYYKIRDMLKEILSRNDNAKFIVTGHSLGGALAILFPAVLAYHGEKFLLDRLEGVFTFGQPRVGDEAFGNYMKAWLEEHNVRYYRFVYGYDIVPRLPYDGSTLMFKHFGTCIFFNRNYHGEVVIEEPNKNYFTPKEMTIMVWNAFMELKRSFTICRSHGKEYREGWLLTGTRVFGLLIPGIPPHMSQDYVNSTRLGPPGIWLPRTAPQIANDQASVDT
ncbi:Triacylglycerol lipase OBL1 [Linum grandiflorum]